MKRNCLLIPALAIASLLSLYAQEYADTILPYLLESERENLLVDGELLYDCFDLSGYSFSSNNGARMSLISDTVHGDFGKKFNLDIKKAGTNAWEPQFQSPLNAIPVDVGDVLEAPAELSFLFYGVDGAMVDSKIVSAPLAGTQTSSFDFSDLPAGIYMCVVDSDAPELAGKTLKIVKE